MATITIYLPEQEPLEIALDGYEQITLGRGPDNDVVLDHPSISSSHAVIQNLGGIFQVTDLGSTNGTFVNDEQVSEMVLGHGSQILFGHVAAQFLDGEAALDAATEMTASGSEGGQAYGSGHHADIAESSSRPAGYVNVSPIEKVVKKDTMATVAMILGLVAIVAALALVTVSAMMKAA